MPASSALAASSRRVCALTKASTESSQTDAVETFGEGGAAASCVSSSSSPAMPRPPPSAAVADCKAVPLSARGEGLANLIDSALAKTARPAFFGGRGGAAGGAASPDSSPSSVSLTASTPPPTLHESPAHTRALPSPASACASSSSASSSNSSTARLASTGLTSRPPSPPAKNAAAAPASGVFLFERKASGVAAAGEPPRRSSRVAALLREEEELRVAESIWSLALPAAASEAAALEEEDENAQWTSMLADRLSVAIPSRADGGLFPAPPRVFGGGPSLSAKSSLASELPPAVAASSAAAACGGEASETSERQHSDLASLPQRSSRRPTADFSNQPQLQCGGSILLRRSAQQQTVLVEKQAQHSSRQTASQPPSSSGSRCPSALSNSPLPGAAFSAPKLAGASHPPGGLCSSLEEIKGLFDSLCVGGRPPRGFSGATEAEAVCRMAASSGSRRSLPPNAALNGTAADLGSGEGKPSLAATRATAARGGRRTKAGGQKGGPSFSLEPFLATEVYGADSAWMDFLQLRRLLGSLLAGDARLGRLSGAGFHLAWMAYRFLARIATEPAVQKALAASAAAKAKTLSTAAAGAVSSFSFSSSALEGDDATTKGAANSLWKLPPSLTTVLSEDWQDRAFLQGAWGKASLEAKALFSAQDGLGEEAPPVSASSLKKSSSGSSGPWQKVFGYGDAGWPRFLCGTIDRRWVLQQRNLSVPVDVAERSSSASAGTESSSSVTPATSSREEVTLQFEEFPASAAQLFWPSPPELPSTLDSGQALQVAVPLCGKNSIWWVCAKLVEFKDGLLKCALDSTCKDLKGKAQDESGNQSAVPLFHPSSLNSNSNTQLSPTHSATSVEKAKTSSLQNSASGVSATLVEECVSSSGETETADLRRPHPKEGSTSASAFGDSQFLSSAGGGRRPPREALEKDGPAGQQPRRSRTGKRVFSTNDLLKKPFFTVSFRRAAPNPSLGFRPVAREEVLVLLRMSLQSLQTYKLSSLVLPQVPVAAPSSNSVRLLPREASAEDFYSGAVLSVSGGALELRVSTGLTRVPDCYYRDVVVHKVLPEGAPAPSWLIRKQSRKRRGTGGSSVAASEEGGAISLASDSDKDEGAQQKGPLSQGRPKPTSAEGDGVQEAILGEEGGDRKLKSESRSQTPPEGTGSTTPAEASSRDGEDEGEVEEEQVLEGMRETPSASQLAILLVLPTRTVRVVSVGQVLSRKCFKLPYDLHAHFGADSFHRLTRQMDDFLWTVPRALAPSPAAVVRRKREMEGLSSEAAASASSTTASAAPEREDWSAFYDVKTKLSQRECLEGPPFCVVYVATNVRSVHKLPKYAAVAALLQPQVDVVALSRGEWILNEGVASWKRPRSAPKALVGGSLEALGRLPCLLRHPSEGLPPLGTPFVVLHSWKAEGWTPPPQEGDGARELLASDALPSEQQSSRIVAADPAPTAAVRGGGACAEKTFPVAVVEGLGGERFDVSQEREAATAFLQRNALGDVLAEEEGNRGDLLLWNFTAPYASPPVVAEAAPLSLRAKGFKDLRLLVAESLSQVPLRQGDSSGEKGGASAEDTSSSLSNNNTRVFKKPRVEGARRGPGNAAGSLSSSQSGLLSEAGGKAGPSGLGRLSEDHAVSFHQQTLTTRRTTATAVPNPLPPKRTATSLLKRGPSTSPATLHRRSLVASPTEAVGDRLLKTKAGGAAERPTEGDGSASDPMLVFSASPSASEDEQERAPANTTSKRESSSENAQTTEGSNSAGPKAQQQPHHQQQPRGGSASAGGGPTRPSRRGGGGAVDIPVVERGGARGSRVEKPKKPPLPKWGRQTSLKGPAEPLGDGLTPISDPV